MFLFQIGAIKSQVHLQGSKVFLSFLFQIGAIKRKT